jgi:hypothetical protein
MKNSVEKSMTELINEQNKAASLSITQGDIDFKVIKGIPYFNGVSLGDTCTHYNCNIVDNLVKLNIEFPLTTKFSF